MNICCYIHIGLLLIYSAYKEITYYLLESLNGVVSMFTKQSNIDLNNRPLKDRFLTAVVNGKIGRIENAGVIVSLKEFKAHFTDIKSDYINSFLPAATIEPGQRSVSHTKYFFRVKKGVYLVHPEVLDIYKAG